MFDLNNSKANPCGEIMLSVDPQVTTLAAEYLKPEAPLPSDAFELGQRCGEELIGQCEIGVGQWLAYREMNEDAMPMAFFNGVDSEVLCCDQCSWWVAVEDFGDYMCKECEDGV